MNIEQIVLPNGIVATGDLGTETMVNQANKRMVMKILPSAQ
jgi:hypothetical protein